MPSLCCLRHCVAFSPIAPLARHINHAVDQFCLLQHFTCSLTNRIQRYEHHIQDSNHNVISMTARKFGV